ncbi:MAG: AGE family epimerase/isomerase [Bacteroidota bacterium]
MDQNLKRTYLTQYREELLHSILPFWLQKSPDRKHGGYFTCLTREGEVFDTDKFVWLQARQVWLFSMLYNRVEKREEWLETALHGAKFLLDHGHDGSFNWYFSLARNGDPLIVPYNIFSNTFAAMAMGQMHLATGNDAYGEAALQTFRQTLKRRKNPKGKWNKSIATTRSLDNFALPMILSNLALEIEHLLDENEIRSLSYEIADQILNRFYRPELGIVLENIVPDGSLSNTFDGRLVLPGHAIEAMWFLMDLGEKFGERGWIEKAADITHRMIDYGWDREDDGLFYYLDRKGAPPQQLEWSQKLWWVHLETAVALIKAYRWTGESRSLEWFQRVHEYNWHNFRDPDYPEWFGYLDRHGELNMSLKGGKWKGCFHVPRALFQIWKTLEILPDNKSEKI